MLVFNMIPNIIIHLQNLFYSLGSFIPDDKLSHNCFQFFIPSLIPSQRCVAEKFIRTTQHLRCGKMRRERMANRIILLKKDGTQGNIFEIKKDLKFGR